MAVGHSDDRVSRHRHVIATAVALAGVLMILTPVPAQAVELSLARASSEIRQVFRQELAWANGRVVSAGLRTCRRRSSRIIDCRSVATIARGSRRDRCTKVYRARRASGGGVRISQSRTGSGFRSHVRSRCRRL